MQDSSSSSPLSKGEHFVLLLASVRTRIVDVGEGVKLDETEKFLQASFGEVGHPGGKDVQRHTARVSITAFIIRPGVCTKVCGDTIRSNWCSLGQKPVEVLQS